PGNLASGIAPLAPRRPRSHLLHLRSGQNRPVGRRRDDDPGTAIVNSMPTTPSSASPTQAAAPANPHNGNRPHGRPRVPSLEACGRRPSARVGSSRRAGIRNPAQQYAFGSRRCDGSIAPIPDLPPSPRTEGSTFTRHFVVAQKNNRVVGEAFIRT